MISLADAAATVLASTLVVTLAVFGLGALIERLRPAERAQPWAHLRMNLGYTVAFAAVLHVTKPLGAAANIAIVNALGGGLVALPGEGWAVVPAAAAFILAMDFMEYVFHRAQHGVPLLWQMHSLHHSDPSLNVTTTMRAFWLEPLIKAVLFYPVVGILFQAPPLVLTIYGMSKLWDFVNHLNLRLHFGRFWVVVNGPQYHRIHHSRDPAHFNRNFAAFFPVWDWLFGTYHRPLPGEFPVTGLDTHAVPRHLLDAVAWPWRRLLSRGRLA
jgi:sterol desaturase/sphingolipid hydroxylase (fatty acid hydroxylase superfamily)